MTTTTAPPPLPVAKVARSNSANLRYAYDMSVVGALGALFGLYLYVELIHTDSVLLRDALAGALIGGSLGLFLNGYGPFRDGSWPRLARAVTLSVPAAAVGGALGLLTGEMVIGILKGGLFGRALSWSVLGLGIGLGQGLADRSRQRLVYGLIGGGLGGFLGGFSFEWLRVAFGNRYDLSQALGIVVLGAGLGLCLALVEQVLRRAWIQIQSGRQEGRIYLLGRARSRLGLDEHAEIGIFGDPAIDRQHAEIEATPGGYLLHHKATKGPTRVNGQPLASTRKLQDGDRIELGRTWLLFRQK